MKIAILKLCLTLVIAGSISYAKFPKNFLSVPKKPTIVYNRVDVKNVTMEKTNVDFVFIVDNPNPFGIENVYADYELFLKGNSTATGKDMKFTIPGNGKSELKLPLEIKYLKVFKSAEELTKTILGGAKTIPFKLEIKFKIDLKGIKFVIPITAHGEIPLPKIESLPKTVLQPKVKL